MQLGCDFRQTGLCPKSDCVFRTTDSKKILIMSSLNVAFVMFWIFLLCFDILLFHLIHSFLRVQLIISRHWSRQWLDALQMTSHFLNHSKQAYGLDCSMTFFKQ